MPFSATPVALLETLEEFDELDELDEFDDAVELVDGVTVVAALAGVALDAPDALAVALLALGVLDAPPPPPPHAERIIAAKLATATCLDIPDILYPRKICHRRHAMSTVERAIAKALPRYRRLIDKTLGQYSECRLIGKIDFTKKIDLSVR
jgi:hypothetical protein